MEWMLGTHLQGPHQSVCWLRPKRARHFLGEPGSEHNAQHAQNKEAKQHEERERERGGQKKKKVRGQKTEEEEGRHEDGELVMKGGKSINSAVNSEEAIKSNC